MPEISRAAGISSVSVPHLYEMFTFEARPIDGLITGPDAIDHPPDVRRASIDAAVKWYKADIPDGLRSRPNRRMRIDNVTLDTDPLIEQYRSIPVHWTDLAFGAYRCLVPVDLYRPMFGSLDDLRRQPDLDASYLPIALVSVRASNADTGSVFIDQFGIFYRRGLGGP